MLGYQYNIAMGKFLVDENVFANIGEGVGTGLFALSTEPIYQYTGHQVIRPESLEYADLPVYHTDWVFYDGVPTGDASDAIVSLGVTKEFPVAYEDWGLIKAFSYSDTGGDGSGAGVFFYYNLPDPVQMVADTKLVLLGSPTRGDGDIVIYPLY